MGTIAAKWVDQFVQDPFTSVILLIIALDSIRAVIAMIGWVKPDKKYAWIIYGRYERNLVQEALKDMGISKINANDIRTNNIHALNNNGIKPENADLQLIALIAKYTVAFCADIQYGGRSKSNSKYYIDTMEIVHEKQEADYLATIMIHLINSKIKEKPEIIFVPKGGNPLLGKQVADHFHSQLVFVKSLKDNSRLTSEGAAVSERDGFKVNYEGSWPILDYKDIHSSIVLDCNASGGTQIIDIVEDIDRLTKKCGLKIKPPEKAFVLFLVDKENREVDKKFEDHNCELIRYFDLDESMKKRIYSLAEDCRKRNSDFNCYNIENVENIKEIIEELKKKNKYYYKESGK